MTTRRWSFEDDVLHYRAAGLPAMAAWWHKVQEYGEEKSVELLHEHPLRVSSLWYGGGTFLDPDELRVGDPVADAIEALDVAEEMRASTMIVVAGPRFRFTRNHARKLLCDALRCLGDQADLRNVSIGLAPMLRAAPGCPSMVNNLKGTLELLNECAHPYVGLSLDLYSFWNDPDLVRQLPAIVPFLKSVTLSDGPVKRRSREPMAVPGDGQIPLTELVGRLCDAGYKGTFDCRVIVPQLSAVQYRPLLARCKAAYARLGERLAAGLADPALLPGV